jgi:hypothetical protein
VFGSAKERDRLESQQASQIGLPDVYLTSPLGKKLGAQEAIGRASTQDESGAIA